MLFFKRSLLSPDNRITIDIKPQLFAFQFQQLVTCWLMSWVTNFGRGALNTNDERNTTLSV